jgi:hypothetical protein
MAQVVSKAPGQVWAPDVQCSMVFGTGATYIAVRHAKTNSKQDISILATVFVT